MSVTSAGQIGLDLVVNQNQFKKQMSGIQSLAKKAGAALAGAFAVKKIVDFGKSCVELGSDLAEVQNVVDVTFPSMTEQVDKFAKSAAMSFGLSETMAKRYTGTFGAMAKAFGFTEQAAYDMSTTLTGLAGDVASFYNISQDEAYTKLKSVFTGETETLKDLGIVMTQNALDAYAMANGYGKTTQAMTEAEKVALRYAFVQSQLTAATGDFARTSGSWANQVRIMKLQFDSLKASIGQGLINLFTPAIKVINTLLGKLTTLANAFKSFTELITGNKSSGNSSVASPVSDLATTATDAGAGLTDASNAADNLSGATKGIGNAAKKAAKEMRSLMGFDQINKLTEQDDSSDSGDGGMGTSPSISGSAGTGAALGSPIDYGSLAKGETALDKLDSKWTKVFENLKKAVQPTIDSLKRLWNEGLARLGNFTWTALKDFYKGFLVPVGKWVFGEGIPRFIDALNNGLMKVDFPRINEALKRLWDVLAPFAINVGEGLLWLWENVLVPLGTWTANEIVPRFLDTLSISIDAVNKIIEALKPLFEWFWENVLLPIAEWTGDLFLQAWDGINNALQRFSDWCGTLEPKVQTLVDKLSNLKKWVAENETALQMLGIAFGGLTLAIIANTVASNANKIAMGLSAACIAVYNGVTTMATAITSAFGAVVAFLTSPITIVIAVITALVAAGVLLYKNWDKVCEKCAKMRDWVVEKTRSLKDGAVKAFNTLKTNVSNAINAVKTTVMNVMGKIKTGVSTRLNSIKTAFSTAFNSIKNTVSRVFNGIWGVIKGVVNSILGGIETMVNGVINGVNTISNAFNNMSIDIPDWVPGVGGGTLGFNLPTFSTVSLPRLAQGGYVKPNTPQLAMIGDNRTQGEIVAPEGKLLEMAKLAAQMSGPGSEEIIQLLKEILALLKKIKPVEIDEESLRKYFIEKTNKNTRSTGKCELVT